MACSLLDLFITVLFRMLLAFLLFSVLVTSIVDCHSNDGENLWSNAQGKKIFKADTQRSLGGAARVGSE